MTHQDVLQDLLEKTSRTFALTIPLLPEPTRREVGVAYLLFRIIDNFEDATHWAPDKRIQALHEFIRLMHDTSESSSTAAHVAVDGWLHEPPLEHAGYLELLQLAPQVLAWHRALAPDARDRISKHLVRTAEGMAYFVGRANAEGSLRLESRDELRDYCFVVAGIVGELLTELYLLGDPALAPIGDALRERARRFGEGLQLVNILKDALPDAQEGRIYLPPELPLAEVFALTRSDLVAALEYAEILRTGQAHPGVVAFNALNARLALATLEALNEHGFGSKLSRVQVSELTADVMQRIHTGHSLLSGDLA
ncbi:MAG: squalene/phytoene synthase family protein [Polyangiales bacterium]